VEPLDLFQSPHLKTTDLGQQEDLFTIKMSRGESGFVFCVCHDINKNPLSDSISLRAYFSHSEEKTLHPEREKAVLFDREF
jgi:hypothetical protein